jgi:hypothetical protein
MIINQHIHDIVRTRSSVIDISHNVQMIHNQSLNQMRQSDDKIPGPSDTDNGTDNVVVVGFLV